MGNFLCLLDLLEHFAVVSVYQLASHWGMSSLHLPSKIFVRNKSWCFPTCCVEHVRVGTALADPGYHTREGETAAQGDSQQEKDRCEHKPKYKMFLEISYLLSSSLHNWWWFTVAVSNWPDRVKYQLKEKHQPLLFLSPLPNYGTGIGVDGFKVMENALSHGRSKELVPGFYDTEEKKKLVVSTRKGHLGKV